MSHFMNYFCSATSSSSPYTFNLKISPTNSPVAPTESFDSIHSPFYLTDCDKIGLSIISKVLDSTTYDNWCIAMTKKFDVKNKIAFIDGSLAQLMVKSLIQNFILKQIHKGIIRLNDASKIWKDQSTRFHITNLP